MITARAKLLKWLKCHYMTLQCLIDESGYNRRNSISQPSCLCLGSINGDFFFFFFCAWQFLCHVQLIESIGAKVIFLPPYSSDLNPLEPVFGKVKAVLKENDSIFQATSTPRVLLAMAFTVVTHEDCLNFSRHCGYY